MQIGGTLRNGTRLATLLALALLMKALVPAGWMPVFEDGTLKLQLCGGWTPPPAKQPVAQAHHGMATDHHAGASSGHHDQHEEEQRYADQPCFFAAAGLSWTATNADPTVEALRPGAAPAAPLPTAVAIGRGLAAPPPPQTGPPLLT